MITIGVKKIAQEKRMKLGFSLSNSEHLEDVMTRCRVPLGNRLDPSGIFDSLAKPRKV